MKFAVAVMTHNPVAGLRQSLLDDTIISVDMAFPKAHKLLFDNGSTDDSREYLVETASAVRWTFDSYQPEDGNHTPGRGRNWIRHHLLALRSDQRWDFDVVVLSDDDMEWKVGASEVIEAIWSNPSEKLVIVCGLLEPVWHWNTPRRTQECGGVNVLVRDSCPGAAWTFRWKDEEKIFPVKADFGYDVDTCRRLVAEGYEVAQVDLAEHAGWGASTHGNEALAAGQPLDRDRWKV
jgi:hypothetical protein